VEGQPTNWPGSGALQRLEQAGKRSGSSFTGADLSSRLARAKPQRAGIAPAKAASDPSSRSQSCKNTPGPPRLRKKLEMADLWIEALPPGPTAASGAGRERRLRSNSRPATGGAGIPLPAGWKHPAKFSPEPSTKRNSPEVVARLLGMEVQHRRSWHLGIRCCVWAPALLVMAAQAVVLLQILAQLPPQRQRGLERQPHPGPCHARWKCGGSPSDPLHTEKKGAGQPTWLEQSPLGPTVRRLARAGGGQHNPEL